MGEPRLSPSQRAYLFHREEFLKGLQTRAESLFQDGYRVSETKCPHKFVIYYPCKEGEKTYFIDALAETCTCPFYARQARGEYIAEEGVILLCKHLRGLKELVCHTRRSHFKEGNTGCGYRLWLHWIATLAERTRRRIANNNPRGRESELIPVASSSSHGKETEHENVRSAGTH